MRVVEITDKDLKPVEISTHTPAGCELVHGDHGLSDAHLAFVDEVMSGYEKGQFVLTVVEMPERLDGLFDSIYGPVNGDDPVTDDNPEVYFEERAGRDIPSRLLDREPRPGARFMVIIGLAGVCLWTAYGSLSGTIAPKEGSDPSLEGEALEEAKKFWAVHALASPRP
jgi:hypothetical protein